MARLSDLQSILLSTASRREGGEMLPYPENVDPRGGAKAVAALLRRGFAEQRTKEGAAGEAHVHITTAGLQAIGIEADVAETGEEATTAEPEALAARPTKVGLLLALIGRPDGAAISDLIEATGWLPHTVRAALTGLRRKGHAICRSVRDGRSCYHIGSAS